MYGYETKKLKVLKAERGDEKAIANLYIDRTIEEKKLIQLNWEKIITDSKDDFVKDVVYVLKDKCNKIIGLVETESEDNKESIEIGFWIPNLAKRATYLNELQDSFIEWCEEEGYLYIKEIKLLIEMTRQPKDAKYITLLTEKELLVS